MNEPEKKSPPPKVKKVLIMLNAVGDAPILKTNRAMIKHSSTFHEIYIFLRRKLKIKSTESMYIYVNQAFCPSPDETVGDLSKYCLTDGKLQLSYCKQPVWG